MLFAAFLGYNPMQQLLGPLLGHLPAGHAAYVTGRQFFPHLITGPFHDGLGVAFAFAIAASLIAAVASLLTGRAPGGRPPPAESLGAELAAVAARRRPRAERAGRPGPGRTARAQAADGAGQRAVSGDHRVRGERSPADRRRAAGPRLGRELWVRIRPAAGTGLRSWRPDGILHMRDG